ncbi:hypothetical protein C8J57DRAFT_1322477 [Mycena rebaudengoi]|nr:hypothetical protein C8J57DRAFT_1322477 [Mycena rebaudengoi]
MRGGARTVLYVLRRMCCVIGRRPNNGMCGAGAGRSRYIRIGDSVGTPERRDRLVLRDARGGGYASAVHLLRRRSTPVTTAQYNSRRHGGHGLESAVGGMALRAVDAEARGWDGGKPCARSRRIGLRGPAALRGYRYRREGIRDVVLRWQVGEARTCVDAAESARTRGASLPRTSKGRIKKGGADETKARSYSPSVNVRAAQLKEREVAAVLVGHRCADPIRSAQWVAPVPCNKVVHGGLRVANI